MDRGGSDELSFSRASPCTSTGSLMLGLEVGTLVYWMGWNDLEEVCDVAYRYGTGSTVPPQRETCLANACLTGTYRSGSSLRIYFTGMATVSVRIILEDIMMMLCAR
jgi:hypothetical protein